MNSKISRRKVLASMAAATCGSLIHNLCASPHSFLAWGQANPNDQKVMIVVNMGGGASYNVTPLYRGEYRDRNRTISFSPQDSLPINSEQGLHPSLTGLLPIYQAGDLAILNLVGYPNPNFSHDASQRIWFSGGLSGDGSYGGWAARMTCQMAGEFSGISLGRSNLLVRGECNAPIVASPYNGSDNGYDPLSFSHGVPVSRFMERMAEVTTPATTEVESTIRERMRRARDSERRLQTTPEADQVIFPNSTFGFTCKRAAELIRDRTLSVRFIYLEVDGFDTHTNERQLLTQLMTDMNGGLSALVAELKRIGRWNDVSIVTMSEFSRTFENGNGGSDHGHAGPMMIMGGGIRGGIKSPAPSASAYRAGYFHDYQIDFRQPFYEIARQMGSNADAIFPERIAFRQLNLFKA